MSTADDLHPVLRGWLFETSLGPMVKHPFVFMPMAPTLLLVEQANRSYAQKIKIRRDYLDNGDWLGYIWSWERPYRMAALAKLWRRRRITADDLRKILPGIWVDTEMPQRAQDDPVFLFREAGFTTDDPDGWHRLQQRGSLTLYRGVDYEFELTADGPSWTIHRRVAEFFAYRFGAEGDVFKYRAPPDEVLAYLTGRDEAECILDFVVSSDPDAIVRVSRGTRRASGSRSRRATS